MANNALQTTKYTGNYLEFVGHESFFILLGLDRASARVVSLYKMALSEGATEPERKNALAVLEGMGKGEVYVGRLRVSYQRYLESRNTPTPSKATSKPSAKKRAKAKAQPTCGGCNKGGKLQKLPHNYGGLRRYIHLCADCLPEVVPIIGHRLTHKPIWMER